MTHADRRQNFINDLWPHFHQSFGLSRSHVSFPHHPRQYSVLESLTFYCTKTCPFSGIETLRLAYRKFPPSNQHDRKKGLPFQKTLKLKRESEASGAEGQE